MCTTHAHTFFVRSKKNVCVDLYMYICKCEVPAPIVQQTDMHRETTAADKQSFVRIKIVLINYNLID